MASLVKKINEAGGVMNALLVIGFLGIVWLMIYGNLSGNLGFAAGTINYNNTEAVMNNLTGGVGTFFGFSGTLFTITAIGLLITILIGLLYLVMSITKKQDTGFQ